MVFMVTWSTTYLTPIIFETIILVIYMPIMLMMVKKARDRKTMLSKILALYMCIHFFSIFLTIFSQFSKWILMSSWISFESAEKIDIIQQIVILVSNWVYYNFFFEVFKTSKNKTKKSISLLVFTIIIFMIILVLAFFPDYNFVISALLLAHSIIFYVPIMIKSFKVYRSVDSGEGTRWAFFFLSLMSFFFVLVWASNLLNAFYDAATGGIYGPFFYIGWIVVLCAIITGYLGFIFPKWFRNLIKKDDN